MAYEYQPTNPMNAFAQSFQFVDQLRQRQAAEQQARLQQEQQAQRQATLQQSIQNIRTNPSPQAIADFYLQFPEMKQEFDAYRGALAEGDKSTLTAAARAAIIAQRSGQSSAGVFRQYAEAAKNGNNAALAKQFEDAAMMAEQSPEGADLTTRMFYQGIDPEGYKAIFEGPYDTAFIKEIVAEGLKPGTPEFQAALKQKREGDPYVVVPGIGLYRRADVEAAAEGDSLRPAIPEAAINYLRQNPNTRDLFDKEYGNGASNRILGGASGNASGGFR